MPKISVILPVYNVEQYLKRCIDSISNQTFVDFDLIIVDDGSPDNSGEICDEYARKDSRINVIHQVNGGLSAARNTGIDWAIENSDSEWITFIDSDDFIHPLMLETLIYGAEKEATDISMGFIKNTHRSYIEEEKVDKYAYIIKNREEYWHMSYEGKPFAPQVIMCVAKLYKKSLISNLRFKNGVTHEDVFWVSDYAQNINKIVVYTQNVYYYYQRAESIVHSVSSKTTTDELNGLLYKVKTCVLKFPQYKEEGCKSFIDCYFICANKYISSYSTDTSLIREWTMSHRREIKKLTSHFLTFGQNLFLGIFPFFSSNFFIKLLDYRLDILDYLYLHIKQFLKTIGIIKPIKKTFFGIQNRLSDFLYKYKFDRKCKKIEVYAKTNPKKCCKYFYKVKMKKRLDLKSPKTFNEKIHWLKLYEILPNIELYTRCADKYLVREFICEKGFSNILVPLIGVFNSPNEINFDSLPNKFVLKANNASGLNLIVKDKSKLKKEEVLNTLDRWLKTEYWLAGGEWQYRDIPPKIVCEEFINPEGSELIDYKFFCYNGKVNYIDIWINHKEGSKPNYIYFDRNLNPVPFNSDTINFINSKQNIKLPNNLEEMITIASELSKGFPFVRVDLYSEYGKIYFGELTFTPCAGVDRSFNELGQLKLGEDIII